MPIVLIGTGAAVGGIVAGRDKKINSSIQDTKTDIEIKKKLQQYDINAFKNVSVTTDNGCVLLTGTVKNDEYIQQAEKIAWEVPEVKIVDNNITIKNISMQQIAKDGYLTAACRAKLLAESDIKSLNIKIKTVDGVVYLSGTAKNQKEIDNIVNAIKQINGIKKIISYISF